MSLNDLNPDKIKVIYLANSLDIEGLNNTGKDL